MFYTNNRFNNMAEIDVEPNMAYAHENGALVAMIEGYENERALFEAAIYTDIQEATLISEGASEEEITALQENAITSFFTKIKEFFKKLWEKIKAVFHGFIARFDAFFKSGDKLVKKYRAELMQKNLKGVDFKFDEPKDWNGLISDPNDSSIVTEFLTTAELDNATKANSDFDSEKYQCDLVKAAIGVNVSDMADFDEEFHDHFFKGEEDVDGESIKKNILDFLEKKNAIKDAEKVQKGLEKAIANIIKKIDDTQRSFDKAINAKDKSFKKLDTHFTATSSGSHASDATAGGSGIENVDVTDSEQTKIGGAALSLLRKKASAKQTVISKVGSASIKELKDLTSRCKATLARMVAAKEESTFLDALEDAVMYETNMELQYGVNTVED